MAREKGLLEKQLYLLLIMVLLCVIASLVFYIFFTENRFNSKETNTVQEDISTEPEVTSPAILDAEATISPAHGDEAPEENLYPMEESIVLAEDLALWLDSWIITHGIDAPFPVKEFTARIAKMRFSEGNIVPTAMQMPHVFSQSIPLFIDALFMDNERKKASNTNLKIYMLRFARQSHALLDAIRTIAPLAQKDFLEMMRITQNIEQKKKELVELEIEIEQASKSNKPNLPSLLEKKFVLRKTISEQSMVLDKLQVAFSSFYSRADIRHFPKETSEQSVESFMLYAPIKDWQSYTKEMLAVFSGLIVVLEEYDV